jgi:hypothetical protein
MSMHESLNEPTLLRRLRKDANDELAWSPPFVNWLAPGRTFPRLWVSSRQCDSIIRRDRRFPL